MGSAQRSVLRAQGEIERHAFETGKIEHSNLSPCISLIRLIYLFPIVAVPSLKSTDTIHPKRSVARNANGRISREGDVSAIVVRRRETQHTFVQSNAGQIQ